MSEKTITKKELIERVQKLQGTHSVWVNRSTTQKELNLGVGSKVMSAHLVVHKGVVKFRELDKCIVESEEKLERPAPSDLIAYKKWLYQESPDLFVFDFDLSDEEKEAIVEFNPKNVSKNVWGRFIVDCNNAENESLYSKIVKDRLLKEGKEEEAKNYQPKPRPWGVRVSNALVTHKDNYYLTIFCLDYTNTETTYVFNGIDIDIKSPVFEPWRSSSASSKGENVVVPIDVEISNIKHVKFADIDNDILKLVD